MYDYLNTTEFKDWPKIPRFFESDITVSEKIDGTNGLIFISESGNIRAGSRTQWIYPARMHDKTKPWFMDNYGFATWVDENSEALIKLLGPGYHHGEWWGRGIQRNYGMNKRVFSLFNTYKWGHLWDKQEICDVVPHKTYTMTKYTPLSLDEPMLGFDRVLRQVETDFMKQSLAAVKYGVLNFEPEGFMIWHDKAKQYFKVPVNK